MRIRSWLGDFMTRAALAYLTVLYSTVRHKVPYHISTVEVR